MASTQEARLAEIAAAIRTKEGSTAPIPANTFADRILVLPQGENASGVILPAASTQTEQLARIAAAIKAKEGNPGHIPAGEFAAHIMALEETDKGLTWIQNTLPASSYYRDITYGNGTFVVVGGYPTNGAEKSMLYSKDGVNWTASTNGLNTRVLYRVAYGPRFVAVGYMNWASGHVPFIMTNGTGAQSWTARNNPSGVAEKEEWRSVAFGGEKFVIVSNKQDAAYSADGITWTLSQMPASAVWMDVAYGNGRFVSVAGSSAGLDKAAYSADGVTWNASTLPFPAYWYCIAYGAGKFVALASESNVYAYSPNGVSWETGSLPSDQKWRKITYSANRFVAVAEGSRQCIYSKDGLTWNESDLNASRSWYSVSYGGGKFVAIPYLSSYGAYTIV